LSSCVVRASLDAGRDMGNWRRGLPPIERRTAADVIILFPQSIQKSLSDNHVISSPTLAASCSSPRQSIIIMPEITNAHGGENSLHYIQNIHLWAPGSVNLGSFLNSVNE
jgi:hypothetical protein